MSLADRLEDVEPTPRVAPRATVSIVSNSDLAEPPQRQQNRSVDPELAAELLPVAIGAGFAVAAVVARAIDTALGGAQFPAWPAVLGLGLLAGILGYLLFREASRSRRDGQQPSPSLSTTVALILALLGVLSVTLAVLQSLGQFGFGFLAIWAASCLLFVPLLQLIANLYRRALVAEGRLQTRVVLFGKSELFEAARLALEADCGSRIVAAFRDDMRPWSNDDSQILDEIVGIARNAACDRVILAFPPSEFVQIKQAADRLSAMPIAVQLWTDAGRLPCPIAGFETIGSTVLLNLQRRPLDARGLIFKTILDYAVAASALVILSPVMLIIAIAIKLDSAGPVFFIQPRGGYRHRPIQVFKFRTMNVMETGDGVKQAERDDPRVTRVGRFLRRTSLDELPQLLNVLRGELSLVGPRPHALAHDRHYEAIVAQYANRAKIKPGITGWAQVNGSRSQTTDPNLMRERVKFDLYYIENWSLWLDVKILARTVRVLFGDRKAY